MKKILLIFATAVLWAGWYICYPNYLRWLEGYSFFSTLPDFTSIYLILPKDIFRYVGAFLLQFYNHPVIGAMVQALFPVVVVLSGYVIVRRLFRNHDWLIWIAFIPLPFFVSSQMDDMTLTHSVSVMSWSLLAMVVMCILTCFGKPLKKLPGIFHHRNLALCVIVASVCISLVTIVRKSPLNGKYEELTYLEYLGNNHQWDKILKTVSAQEAIKDEFKRKYALLALSETGLLTEYAFRYGLSSPDDFVYMEAEDPFRLNFNMLYYRCLGMNNPVIHQAYQQAVQSLPGVTFHSIRTLADIYLEYKDYDLAKKYIDILSHSTCHGKWVKERLPILESIKGVEPDYNASEQNYRLDNFFRDISAMVDRHQGDPKYADLLMCGVLSQMDGNRFLQVFHAVAPSLYVDGRRIPTLYQEALLLIASKEPDILQMYRIDEEVWEKFTDFTNLMSSGKTAQAKRKYAGTYWAYVY